MFAIYPIGAAAIVAVQIAQSLPDVETDRAAGVRTLAVAIGAAGARLACWGAMVLATGLAVILAPWLTNRPGLVWVAAAIATTLVVANALVWRNDARRGILTCFPMTAAGVVVLCVAWTAALAIP
jgi:4-hydroxybenzoate polyprenyltransferase